MKMKLNKKIIYAFLVVTAAIAALSSCSSDDYVGAEVPNNAQVYFSNENSSEFLLEADQNSVQVEVKRVKTEGAITVEVGASEADGNSIFTVAGNITFADGEDVAYIPVTFNFSDLTPDTDYELTLKLLSETSAYGDAEKTFVIKYAPWSEWAPLGWEYPEDIAELASGQYAAWEEAYTEFAAGGYEKTELIAEDGDLPTYTYAQIISGTYSQPLFYRESALNPDNAQLMLYDWFYGINLTIDWNKASGEFSVAQQYSGYTHSSYGLVYVADSYTYWHDFRGQDVTKDNFPCSYDEENGLFTINMAYFVDAGYFGYGNEYIQLPGFVKKDYTLSIVDEGVFQSGTQLGEVFNFTLGSDLGKVQYAVFAGSLTTDEIETKADAIFSGEIESTVTTESGYKVVMVSEEGDYTLVAVLYDTDGNRLGNSYAMFTVKASTAANTWTAIYKGDYTYTLFFGDEDAPVTDEGLTLYQCNEDPTLFKIEHWGFDVDFTFTMDSNGNIMVDDQPTGYESSSYGMVMVDDLVDYTGSTRYGESYYSNGTFNFAIVYYVSAGVFGYGTETFKLTGQAANAVNKALAAVKVKADAANVSTHKAKLNVNSGQKVKKDIVSKKKSANSPKFTDKKVLSTKKLLR